MKILNIVVLNNLDATSKGNKNSTEQIIVLTCPTSPSVLRFLSFLIFMERIKIPRAESCDHRDPSQTISATRMYCLLLPMKDACYQSCARREGEGD